MSETRQEKLELMFQHLSMNNIQHVKPLIKDTLTAFERIESKLASDLKKRVSVIRTLLKHVENEEWLEAREILHETQTAYQEYLEREKHVLQPQESVVNGKNAPIESSSNHMSWARPQTCTLDRTKYMFKDRQIYNELKPEDLERRQVGPRCSSAGTRRLNIWSSTYRSRPGTAASNTPSATRHRPWSAVRLDTCTMHSTASQQKTTEVAGTTDEGALVNDKRCSSMKSNREASQRPTVIADAFLDLYKHQWQLALEALKQQALSEVTSIQCLLYILMEAYRLTLQEAKIQVLEFENAALNIITNGHYTYMDKNKLGGSGNIKHMVEYRKDVADLALERLQEQFLTRTLPLIHRRYGVIQNAHVDGYTQHCINVTWKMVIQDPVYYINSELTEYSELDLNLYEPYDSCTGRVCYLVWPAMRLYQGGPVLCRGKVKCYGNKDNTNLK